MRATLLLSIGVLICAVLVGCQTAPKTASEVAAQTQVLPEDSYGRPRSVIGPPTKMAHTDKGEITAHLALASPDEIWMLCVALINGIPPNLMRFAVTSDRKEMPLVRLSHDIALGSGDRFTVVLPRKLLDAKRTTGLKLKFYGTRAEIEVEIPAWYLEGYLGVVGSR